MNQGKLDVIKLEMEGVNINILRISTKMDRSGQIQMTIISTTMNKNQIGYGEGEGRRV